MRITRTSLAKRYAQRTIAEGHGGASLVGGPGPDGAQALTFGWTIRTEEQGKSVQYTASITEAELDALLALRARLKTAGKVDPERASPELIAAVAVRLDRLDQAQARREAQLRGDGSPN